MRLQLVADGPVFNLHVRFVLNQENSVTAMPGRKYPSAIVPVTNGQGETVPIEIFYANDLQIGSYQNADALADIELSGELG